MPTTAGSGEFPRPEPHQLRHVAESFGINPERYDRARPRYPDALVRRILTPHPRGDRARSDVQGGFGQAGDPGGPAQADRVDGRSRVDGLVGRARVDVLDVGCGTGIAARQFQAAGCSVLGVEPDERMAEFARRGGLAVEVGTFEAWEPDGRTFDVVTAAQSWHWVDPVVGAAKAVRVLRPGGRLAIFAHVFEPPPPVAAAFATAYRRVAADSPVPAAYRQVGPDSSAGEQVPHASLREQGPDANLRDQGPDVSLREQVPDAGLHRQVPDVGLRDQVSDVNPLPPDVNLRLPDPSLRLPEPALRLPDPNLRLSDVNLRPSRAQPQTRNESDPPQSSGNPDPTRAKGPFARTGVDPGGDPAGGGQVRRAVDVYLEGFAKLADGLREVDGFATVEQWRFDWERTYTRDEWLELLPTTGGLTRLPADKLAEVLAEVGAAIDAMGGAFTMSFPTLAVVATARS